MGRPRQIWTIECYSQGREGMCTLGRRRVNDAVLQAALNEYSEAPGRRTTARSLRSVSMRSPPGRAARRGEPAGAGGCGP